MLNANLPSQPIRIIEKRLSDRLGMGTITRDPPDRKRRFTTNTGVSVAKKPFQMGHGIITTKLTKHRCRKDSMRTAFVIQNVTNDGQSS